MICVSSLGAKDPLFMVIVHVAFRFVLMPPPRQCSVQIKQILGLTEVTQCGG
jgi:hypothetical protein